MPTPSSFGEVVYSEGKVEKPRRPWADVKLSHLCRFVNDKRDERVGPIFFTYPTVYTLSVPSRPWRSTFFISICGALSGSALLNQSALVVLVVLFKTNERPVDA